MTGSGLPTWSCRICAMPIRWRIGSPAMRRMPKMTRRTPACAPLGRSEAFPSTHAPDRFDCNGHVMTKDTAAEETRLLVHASVDGELDPANARAVERQIAADPALAAERAQVETLRRVLRETLPPRPLPPHLRSRIEAAVGLHRTRGRPSWRALAASVALALMVASVSTWVLLRPAPGGRIAEA